MSVNHDESQKESPSESQIYKVEHKLDTMPQNLKLHSSEPRSLSSYTHVVNQNFQIHKLNRNQAAAQSKAQGTGHEDRDCR